MPIIDYTVDGEPQQTTDKELTAGQILLAAGRSADEYYLIQLRGSQQESYQNKPNEVIKMHERIKFITVFVGPTPVS